MSGSQTEKLKTLHQTFITADKDGDSLLNKEEFEEFVETGYHKQCPDGMYENLCIHFNRDASIGIDWNTATTIWLQAQKSPSKIKSPPPTKQNAKPPNLKQIQISLSKISSLPPTNSTGSVYKKHQSGQSVSERNQRVLDDEQSMESDNQSYYSQNRRHRQANSDGPFASQMVLQIMESKVKNLQKQLKLERTKRKKTEEMTLNLVTTNKEYQKQIGDLQTTFNKTKTEKKEHVDNLRKLKIITDDNHQTINCLKQQRNAMKAERDETFSLLIEIEKEHAIMIKKEKTKHKLKMDKLYADILESLDCESGKDIMTVIHELKTNNHELQNKVDILVKTFARKQQSLLEALQAGDHIAMQNISMNNIQQQPSNNKNGKMRQRLKALIQNNNNNHNNHNNKQISIQQNEELLWWQKRKRIELLWWQRERESKLINSTLTIRFLHKPFGITLYRGCDDKNAWIADIKENNMYVSDGLCIGLYVHTVNAEIVDNYSYYDILSMVKDTPAPITVGFNSYPPLNENDINIAQFIQMGYTFDDIQCAWKQLNEQNDTMTTQHIDDFKMFKILSNFKNIDESTLFDDYNNKKLGFSYICKHRLCIAGFIRRIDNIDIFQKLQVPLDIHNIIYWYYVLYKVRLIFCDENGYIDKHKYVERGIMHSLQLKHLYVTLQHELCFVNVNNDGSLAELHLWMKYGVINAIYPINQNVIVTKEEILSQDQNRWVEIPYDYLKTNLCDLNDLTIAIEMKNIDGSWPRRKGDDWLNIQCGDILEAKDAENKWYESMVRYIYPKQNYIIVHYIGWNIKWDERLSIISDIDRIAPRYTNTKRPHRDRADRYPTYIKNPCGVYVVFGSIRAKIKLTRGTYKYFVNAIKHRFCCYDDIEITTCSGFKIKDENSFKEIVPYYVNNLFVKKRKSF